MSLYTFFRQCAAAALCVVVLACLAAMGGTFLSLPADANTAERQISAAYSQNTSSVSTQQQRSSEPENTSFLAPQAAFSRQPLTMPFSAQAPYNDWSALYQETCEEMVLIMMDAYFSGKESLPPDIADARIHELLDWETRMGYGESLTLEETAALAENYFGWRATVTSGIRHEHIQHALDTGTPVIVPTAGRRLFNPYFQNGGPWYHMLIIVGADANAYIVHDPGTQHGALYRYQKEILFDAIHDWTGVPERIDEGGKRMLTIVPKAH